MGVCLGVHVKANSWQTTQLRHLQSGPVAELSQIIQPIQIFGIWYSEFGPFKEPNVYDILYSETEYICYLIFGLMLLFVTTLPVAEEEDTLSVVMAGVGRVREILGPLHNIFQQTVHLQI